MKSIHNNENKEPEKPKKIKKPIKVHKMWKIKPFSKPHSTKNGKKGYDRKNKSWKKEKE